MKLKRIAPLLPESVRIAAQLQANEPPQHTNVPVPFNGLFHADIRKDPVLYARIKAFADDGNEVQTVGTLTSLILDDLVPIDVEVDDGEYGSPRYYARIHAIRSLCSIACRDATLAERFIPMLLSNHDDLKDEMPALFASFGSDSLEVLRPVVEDSNQDSEARQRAATCMEKVAHEHPDTREGVLEFITRMLEESGDDLELAGSLVANLVDLDGRDALPIIEQAYRDGRVDSGIIRLSDVYDEFGIARRRRT